MTLARPAKRRCEHTGDVFMMELYDRYYVERQFHRVVRERETYRAWSWFWFACCVVAVTGFVCAFYGIIHA